MATDIERTDTAIGKLSHLVLDQLEADLAAVWALADDAAALLKLAKAKRPTLTLADIDAWLARYREARQR